MSRRYARGSPRRPIRPRPKCDWPTPWPRGETMRKPLERFLHLLTVDQPRFGEPARKAMLDIFQVLGPQSDLVKTYRRKLSTALY